MRPGGEVAWISTVTPWPYSLGMELFLPDTAHWRPGPTVRSYWVVDGALLGGAYPGKQAPGSSVEPDVVAELLACGVGLLVNLTEDYPGGTDEHLDRYDPYIHDTTVLVRRFPIPDVSVPSNPLLVSEALDCIDQGLAEGRTVYVHCWGGVGRTALVLGCWMIRHGHATPATVFEVLTSLRRGDRGAGDRPAPETSEQRALVAGWSVGR